MKKILFVFCFLFVFSFNAFADEDDKNKVDESFFTQDDLQGKWEKITWPDFLKEHFKFIDIGEQKYEMMVFTGDKYMSLSSEEEPIDLKKLKIFNYNDFKLSNKNPKNQWIELYIYPKWIYLGITKITPKTALKKEAKGVVILDFQVGDMILTFYKSDGTIVYRNQYRKL